VTFRIRSSLVSFSLLPSLSLARVRTVFEEKSLLTPLGASHLLEPSMVARRDAVSIVLLTMVFFSRMSSGHFRTTFLPGPLFPSGLFPLRSCFRNLLGQAWAAIELFLVSASLRGTSWPSATAANTPRFLLFFPRSFFAILLSRTFFLLEAVRGLLLRFSNGGWVHSVQNWCFCSLFAFPISRFSATWPTAQRACQLQTSSW